MGDKKKVVYVDFRKRRKPGVGGFGGSPRQLSVVFLATLTGELALAAVLYPRWIASGFFAPTVIAVAVAATLGVRRLITRQQIAYLHNQHVAAQDRTSKPDHDRDGRTLH
ncbi:MAG: hypothetical protein P1P84_18890 [Deferrisomatales bacterium]|nr:hypothetical protein [Deferrisomatales bacterium]